MSEGPGGPAGRLKIRLEALTKRFPGLRAPAVDNLSIDRKSVV